MRTKSSKLICSAVLLAASGAAHAVDVDKEAKINAAPGDVWAKVGDWCAIADWHPVVVSCEQMTSGSETRRVLTLGDGGTIKELMTATSDTSYSYHIEESPLPVDNYNATFAAAPDGDGTRLTWNAKFDAKGASDEEAGGVIGGVFDAGLESIVKMMAQ